MPDAVRVPGLSKLLAVCKQAAATVGARARRRHRRLGPGDVRRKGEGDFVTSVDLQAERWLRRELGRALPGAGFLGEEDGARDLGRDLVFVVDPIDGTSNFANGLPHYAVAIALLAEGTPALSAIWAEPEGVLYWAVAGRGAFRAGRRIRVPRGRRRDAAIYGCQWFRGQQNLTFLARLQRGGARIRTFGCTVVQMLDVAMGRLDGNVQQQGRLWDYAAPAMVLQEAGGLVTDWNGAPLFPCHQLDAGHVATIAAHPRTHRELLAMLGHQRDR